MCKGGNCCRRPVGVMILVQIAYSGVNVLYKLAISDGMNARVLVAYRYMFGAAFLLPLAFFLERKSRPTLTWMVVLQGFCSGLFGGTMTQNLYITALSMTSVTFVTAMANLTPAITFIMAVSCGLEKLAIWTASGQAKVLGLVNGIGGAMILTFYKGLHINLWSSKINLLGPNSASPNHMRSNQNALGLFLAIASSFSSSIWLIIQAKMSKRYPCHYSSIALMCFMASIQSVIFALFMDRDWSQWKLSWNIRLLTVISSGPLASGLVVGMLAWCIKQRGPLFVSVFSPLTFILVTIQGSLLLDENLYLGSMLGAVLIIIGLYIVLWGKSKEMQKSVQLPDVPLDEVSHEAFDHDNEDLESSSHRNFDNESKISIKQGAGRTLTNSERRAVRKTEL